VNDATTRWQKSYNVLSQIESGVGTVKKAVLGLIFAAIFTSASFAQSSEKDLARVPLENYIKGHATVDIEYTRKAFHPVGSLQFVRDGAFASQSVDEYIKGLAGRKPAADERERRRYIESIDVTGNAAIAKVVSDYPSTRYVDYMALLKIDGEWKIVNKIYFAEAKRSSAKRTENASEKDAVKVPLENYLRAHATGDGVYHRRAFHTEGNLIFIRDGKYTTRSFTDYIAGSSGKPASDEDKRKRWIESVDVVGNAAMAKIILDYPTVKFTDYMSLLKINGEWKIVNKSFFAEPKPAPEVKKAQ
jgi:hypothetical protein